MNIIISRTDSIGDVVLTLPLAGYLKKVIPGSKIYFIGRTYTKYIIELSDNIDVFVNWDDLLKLSAEERLERFAAINAETIIHVFPHKNIAGLAKKARITNRIGTSHRKFHWLTCNRMINFSRKKSNLHESQLNFKLLSPLGINYIPALDEISGYYGYPLNPVSSNYANQIIDKNRIPIILHPRSKGSAREWGLSNFSELISLLPANKFQVFVSGTSEDGALMVEFLNTHKNEIVDLTGKLSLNEFIALISNCRALVAASTGPLHIAAALGIKAIGLYAPMRPIHAGRWAPIGKKAVALVIEKECSDCRKSMDCACIRSITPQMVVNSL